MSDLNPPLGMPRLHQYDVVLEAVNRQAMLVTESPGPTTSTGRMILSQHKGKLCMSEALGNSALCIHKEEWAGK